LRVLSCARKREEAGGSVSFVALSIFVSISGA
jgi:hypothetical protein